MKILLVEDDPSIREALREILEMEKHQCTEVADGLLATEILKKSTAFDLLITDFRMPNINGAELLGWCRKNAIHFPVIFITADRELLHFEKIALSDCCAVLLRKPIHVVELLTAISDSQIRNHNRHFKD